MQEEILIKNEENETLVATVSLPENANNLLPITVMAPGFTSKRQNSTNRKLTELLIPKGIATLMIDLSGHGDSEGDIADQTLTKAKSEISCVFNKVRELDWVDKTRIALLGSSFSGNAMLLYAATDSQLKAIAMKSPITNYAEVRERQLGKDRIKEWRTKGYIEVPGGVTSKYEFYEDALRIDTYTAIEMIKAPILVVQGDQDEDIPMTHVERLKKVLNFNKDRLEIIHGADHGYTNPQHFGKMISILDTFLTDHLTQ